MLVIAEASQKSLDLCSKIIDLSRKLGVINIYLIVNKVIDESQLSIINDRIRAWKVPLYHSIPFDSEIGKADLSGASPLDFDPSYLIYSTEIRLSSILYPFFQLYINYIESQFNV